MVQSLSADLIQPAEPAQCVPMGASVVLLGWLLRWMYVAGVTVVSDYGRDRDGCCCILVVLCSTALSDSLYRCNGKSTAHERFLLLSCTSRQGEASVIRYRTVLTTATLLCLLWYVPTLLLSSPAPRGFLFSACDPSSKEELSNYSLTI